MSQLKQAIEDAGGLVTVADAFGVSAQRLWNWADRGVPVEWCARVERMLNVPRWVLRPADWQLIWPELIGTEGAPDVPATSEEDRS